MLAGELGDRRLVASVLDLHVLLEGVVDGRKLMLAPWWADELGMRGERLPDKAISLLLAPRSYRKNIR